MRVLFDATYAARARYSGTGVYIERLLDALSKLEEVELATVANARRRGPAGGGLGSLRNLLTDRWWTATELPRLARQARAEVIHHPLPAFTRWTTRPQVITVHDLVFERLPERFDRRFRRYASITHRSAARAAAAVLCVSHTTAIDARALWGLEPERIVVAPLGPGQEIEPRRRRPRHFLYVGDDEPRKNLRVLLEAYAAYRRRTPQPHDLVLAGAARRDGAGVSVEAQPSRDRLAELYGAAVALIQPSLYEGFGLTALEAMAAGAPVLASNIASLREVCGPAALYADPHDPRSFAGAMVQLAEQQRLRQDLSARGRRRAAEFSWGACARATLDAYTRALSSAAAPSGAGAYPLG